MIEAAGVVMSFRGPRGRRVRVLDGVDLSIAPGRVAALMGGNGAGKTTLLRILAALIRPDSGSVRVAGASAAAEPDLLRARTGLLTEEPGLAETTTPLWQVALHGSLSGLERARAVDEAARILTSLELGPRMNLPAGFLSKGGRRKVALARVLVRSTPVLLLDEPAANLDSASARWLWREVRRRAAAGGTALIVTHDARQAAMACDQIHHLREGRSRPPAPGRPTDRVTSR